jgi:hypothetical protein
MFLITLNYLQKLHLIKNNLIEKPVMFQTRFKYSKGVYKILCK